MVWRMEKKDAWTLLGELAAEVWGLSPLPEAARLPGGKPWFPDCPERRFSVSHTLDFSLCALSDKEVGADVELVRPRREKFPRWALSDREFHWFSARGSTWEDFYTLWTMKEARVKCTGEGLSRPVREIAVPLMEPGETAELDGFFFTALAGDGWRGAVCEEMEGHI